MVQRHCTVDSQGAAQADVAAGVTKPCLTCKVLSVNHLRDWIAANTALIAM